MPLKSLSKILQLSKIKVIQMNSLPLTLKIFLHEKRMLQKIDFHHIDHIALHHFQFHGNVIILALDIVNIIGSQSL